MKYDYEVLIVGGGPAGLSAGMTLGRIGRSALICDDGRPRNAPSAHMNNFPSQDGLAPSEWRERTREDLAKYETIHLRSDSVRSIERHSNGFTARLGSDQIVSVKKIVLAHGITDRLPDAPGFKELWGKSVFHCAYCHGYEVRNTGLGLVANGDFAHHLVPLMFALSQDLILFTNEDSQLSEPIATAAERKGIRVIESPIASLEHTGEKLSAVLLKSGERIERDGLFVAPLLPFRQKSSLGDELGCERNEFGLYKVGPRNETTVPGVFAAGDNMTMQQSVLLSCAAGVMAASQIVFDLVNEDFKQ